MTVVARFADQLDLFTTAGNGAIVSTWWNARTGWGSWLQDNHPEWFLRKADGHFESPGAWGNIWADLVELAQRDPALLEHIAEALLTWCRRGVDGFRCDAGYKVPAPAWQHIIARVRELAARHRARAEGDMTDIDQVLRLNLLSRLLLDNSSSPLMHALETTALGSAPSPLCGLDDSARELLFAAGVEGSEPEHAEGPSRPCADRTTRGAGVQHAGRIHARAARRAERAPVRRRCDLHGHSRVAGRDPSGRRSEDPGRN